MQQNGRIPYFECSATQNLKVNDIFYEMAEDYYN